MRSHNKRGLTLIEVLIAVVMASILMSVVVTMMFSTLSDSKLVSQEHDVQNQVRTTMINVENIVKSATAVFTVGVDKFNPKNPSSMTSQWNYIGLSADRSKVMNYIWVWDDKKNNVGHHEAHEVATPGSYAGGKDKNVYYTLDFYKGLSGKEEEDLREERMVKIALTGEVRGTKSDRKENVFDLTSEVRAENLNQILDSRSSSAQPITAIAYRTATLDDPAIKKSVDAAVVFVMDLSGSMRRGMNGDERSKETRLDILNAKARGFVKELEKVGNIDLYIQPFTDKPMYSGKRINYEEYTREPTIHRDLIYDMDGSKYKIKFSWGRLRVRFLEQIPDYGFIPLYERMILEATSSEQKDLQDRIRLLKSQAAIMKSNLMHKNFSPAPLEEILKNILLREPFKLKNDLSGTTNAQIENVYSYFDKIIYAYGGTNTGAAFQEAYKTLAKSNKPKKYIVFLSDGKPENFYYKEQSSYNHFVFGTKEDAYEDLNRGWDRNPNDNTRPALDYVKKVMSSSYGLNKNIDKTFLIGFSAVESDISQMKDIESYSNAGGGTKETKYISAQSATSLEEEFEAIAKAIQKDMWYFKGP